MKYWTIEDPKLGLVHISTERIDHPLAAEFELPEVQWVRKDAEGAIVDLCDHFPLHPDAYATRRDDPEVLKHLADAADRKRKREADAELRADLEARRNAALDALIARAETSGKSVVELVDLAIDAATPAAVPADKAK